MANLDGDELHIILIFGLLMHSIERSLATFDTVVGSTWGRNNDVTFSAMARLAILCPVWKQLHYAEFDLGKGKSQTRLNVTLE
jgi:hypothetical protein